MTTASIVPARQAALSARPQEANPTAAYLASLGASSRRTQQVALRAAMAAISGRSTEQVTSAELALFPWHQLTAAHVAAMRAALEARYAPAMCNKTLAAVRGVLKAAWRLGLMTADEHARASDVPPVHGSRLPAGRDISPGEIAALLQTCAKDKGPAGTRDAALIALGVTCGLRIAEAAGLEAADYDPQTGRLVIRGKGGKERTAFAVNGAADALADWLTLRGATPGPLFCRILKGGAIVLAPISTTSLGRMLHGRAEEAGVDPFTWHDLRRTAAGDLLDAGADIATVQRLLGHASPATTSRYDRRPEETKRQAVARLHVPYRRRR